MTVSGLLHSVIYAVLIAASFGLWRKYIYSFSVRTLNDLLAFVSHVSLDDLQTLLHPEVEQHIQITFPAEKFRSLQWKRIQLTLRFVGDITDNAKVLQA